MNNKKRFKVTLIISYILAFSFTAYVGYNKAISDFRFSSRYLETENNILHFINIEKNSTNTVNLVYTCNSQPVTILNVDTNEVVFNPMFAKLATSDKLSDDSSQLKTAIISSLSAFSISKLSTYSKSLLSTDAGESMAKVTAVAIVASLSGYYIGYNFGENWFQECAESKNIQWINDKENWLKTKEKIAWYIKINLAGDENNSDDKTKLEYIRKRIEELWETKKFESEYFNLGKDLVPDFNAKYKQENLQSFLISTFGLLSASIMIITVSFELINLYRKKLLEKKEEGSQLAPLGTRKIGRKFTKSNKNKTNFRSQSRLPKIR